jgi:hypothetical protein
VGRGLGRASWVLQPDVGVGGGIALLRLDGHAGSSFESGNANVWLGRVTARVGVGMRIWGGLRVRVDGEGGVAIPEGSVSFAGVRVARWGEPVVGGQAGLEVGWR